MCESCSLLNREEAYWHHLGCATPLLWQKTCLTDLLLSSLNICTLFVNLHIRILKYSLSDHHLHFFEFCKSLEDCNSFGAKQQVEQKFGGCATQINQGQVVATVNVSRQS